MARTEIASRSEQPASTRLPDDVAAAVRAMMRKAHVPGLSLAVVNRERLLFAGAAGFADLATAAPADARTAYLWFSMSKVVTATAALRLADEGRLDLDAPADAYIDYLRAPGSRQPSVRDLLRHTAGLGNPVPIRWAHPAGTSAPDPEFLLRRLLGRHRIWRHPIGRQARYSNVGYLAAGAVIAAAAGTSFQTEVRRAVLDPAGMTRTGFAYQPDADVATGYVRAPRVAHPLLRAVLPAGVAGHRQGRFLALNRFHVDGPAFGGLVGDVLDAGQFLRLHLNDGELDGRRILNSDTARSMRALERPGRPFDHATGWFRRPTTGAGDWVEHFGAGAGFYNAMRLYPDRALGIVVMANTTTAYDFDTLFDMIAGASWS